MKRAILAAAIVTGGEKPFIAKRRHHLNLVLRHGPE